jgi:predicted DNA-binding ribbon-helix-helix protein
VSPIIFANFRRAKEHWRRHSFRIDGHVTSICIENLFFDVLCRLAHESQTSINAILRQLHCDYLCEPHFAHSRPCFASYLRVRCFEASRNTLQRYPTVEQPAAGEKYRSGS